MGGEVGYVDVDEMDGHREKSISLWSQDNNSPFHLPKESVVRCADASS